MKKSTFNSLDKNTIRWFYFMKPIFFTVFLIVVGCKAASADTIPATMKRFVNVHPRLYMTAESEKVLKSKMNTQPYASMFEKLKAIADKAVSKGPTAYYPAFSAGPGAGADLEQLWQREIGNAIPELAMAYCMTGTRKYLNAARYYMLASASYPTWGMGRLDNYDLATAHQLYGIALGYDWLYDDLDEGSRDYIRNCLIRRGGQMYDLITEGKWGYADHYLHNHQHVDLTGLITAGLALYGENKDVDKWILISQQKLKRAVSSMPPDGGCLEGIPYSEYSIEYLMKFMALNNELLGEDLFKSSSFFRNLTSFRLYAMIPKDYWELDKCTLMSLGDGPRVDWYGPDYLLRKLASEYNDGYAQWLANEMDSAGFNAPQAFFLNLLWVNAKIKAEQPDKPPLFKHFNDLDIAYMRSGWSGKESLSMFKCGPWIGHRAASEYTYDPYGGHTQPDVGTFQIFSHGDWLIAYPGYAWKSTIYENTLVINNQGQIGEGRWFSGGLYVQAPEQPGIVYTSSNKDYDYMIGNAKPAYPPATHLTSFYRHILYLKPDCWVIADEVKADSLSSFDFYYHSDFPFSPDGANSFKVEGTRGSTSVTLLKPGGATTETFLQDIRGTGGQLAKRMNALKVGTKDKTEDLFITVFDAYATGRTPAIQSSIIPSKASDFLVLKSKNKTWHFKIASNRNDKNTPLLIEMK